MTIQNAPPGLDYDRDKKFSKVLVFFLAIVTQYIDYDVNGLTQISSHGIEKEHGKGF